MASSVMGFLRRMAGGGRDGDVPDRDLLERFVRGRDEAAFAALVARHGPMVLGVCRRVLGATPDAEDAFQATFLVLARRAASVARPEVLGGWLHGVASRTALKARTAAARRRFHERHAAAAPAAPAEAEPDLRPLLDEELAQLTDRHRAPLVLCYLEGKTTEEAARQLGCPKGTVLSRLARAREQLRRRLVRRGLALSALPAVAGGPPLPPSLAEITTKTALAFAAGRPATGPAPAAVLAEGVLRSMFLTKLKTVAALAGSVVFLAAGAVVVATGGSPVAPEAAGGPPAATAGKDKTTDDQRLLQGSWAAVSGEANGQKLAAEALKEIRVVFKGDEITFYPIREKERMTFRLDPSATPRTISVSVQEGSDKGQTIPAIYDLRGDRLKLCITLKPGVAAPREFAARAGSDLMLLELKREPDRLAADREKLQGTWKVVAAEAGGHDELGKEIKAGTMVIRGNQVTTIKDDGSRYNAEFKIDPTQKPKAIDVIPTDGPEGERGKTFRGIYKIDGDKLTLCTSGPDMERPTEFKSAEGSQVILLTLKRQTPAGSRKK